MIVAQDLVGKSVISTSEGKVLGSITQCVCNLSTGEIVGLLVDASKHLLGEKAIAGKDIDVIGEDAVLVASEKQLVDSAKVKGLEDLARPEEADPMAVFTTEGRRLGSVGHIMIDRQKKAVVGFELTGGALHALTEGTSVMPLVEGLVHGEDSILVPLEAVEKVVVGESAIARVWRGVSERLAQLTRERAADEKPEKKSDKAEPAKAKARKPKKKAAKKPAAVRAKAKATKKPRRRT